ncbi:MAG: hypothetical protein RL518_1587 [Pseudomonadota bacterium]
MRINLASTHCCTIGEIRSLVVRNLVYGVMLIVASYIVMVVVKAALEDEEFLDSLAISVSSERLSQCRSELENLQRQRQWISLSQRIGLQSVKIVRALERLMPADVWLTELTVGHGTALLAGFSRSDSSVSAFLQALKEGEELGRPRLESSRLAPHMAPDAREFRISSDGLLTEGN